MVFRNRSLHYFYNIHFFGIIILSGLAKPNAPTGGGFSEYNLTVTHHPKEV